MKPQQTTVGLATLEETTVEQRQETTAKPVAVAATTPVEIRDTTVPEKGIEISPSKETEYNIQDDGNQPKDKSEKVSGPDCDSSCTLIPTDPKITEKVQKIVKEKAKLIRYRLEMDAEK